MQRAVLVVVLACLFCGLMGCDTYYTDEDGTRREMTKVGEFIYDGTKMETFEIVLKGHKVWVTPGYHQGGMMHSPDCPCLRKQQQ